MRLTYALEKYNCSLTTDDIICIVFDFERGMSRQPIAKKYLPHNIPRTQRAMLVGKIVDEYGYHTVDNTVTQRKKYWAENRLWHFMQSLSLKLGQDVSVNYNAESYIDSVEEQRIQENYNPNDNFFKHFTKTNKVNYHAQKSMAFKRGISWEFNSFEEWLSWWLQTGKFDQRGVTNDKYQMCRYGDTGPYSPSNVYCATGKQNKNDFWSIEENRIANGIKISKLNEKPLQTPLGSFKSRREAANAHNVTFNTIIRRIKKQPTEYYDI